MSQLGPDFEEENVSAVQTQENKDDCFGILRNAITIIIKIDGRDFPRFQDESVHFQAKIKENQDFPSSVFSILANLATLVTYYIFFVIP